MPTAPRPQARERRTQLGIGFGVAHDLEPELEETLAQLALGHEMIRMQGLAMPALALGANSVTIAWARRDQV